MMYTNFKKKTDESNVIRKYIAIIHLNLYIIRDLTNMTCFEELFYLKLDDEKKC